MGSQALAALSGFLLILGTAGAAKAKPQAFDLQCEETRYRIDLTNRLWCEAECEEMRRLAYRGGATALLTWDHHFSLEYNLRRRVITFASATPGEAGEMFRRRCRQLAFSGFPAAAQRP